MSAFISAAPGWVAKVSEGSYRSVVGFDAESGEAVIVKRPDLGDGDDVIVGPAFYGPEKSPAEPE